MPRKISESRSANGYGDIFQVHIVSSHKIRLFVTKQVSLRKDVSVERDESRNIERDLADLVVESMLQVVCRVIAFFR